MSESPMLMLVKRGAVSASGKALAHKAGVVVVECDDPASVKLLRADHEVSHGALLIAALTAIRSSLKEYPDSQIGRRFAQAVADALVPNGEEQPK